MATATGAGRATSKSNGKAQRAAIAAAPADGEAVTQPTVVKNRSKGKPFDLGAAIAHKLRGTEDVIVIEAFDVTLEAQSMALWTEDQINELQLLSPFATMRYVFGEEATQQLADALAENGQALNLVAAKALMDEFRKRSGMGDPGE